MEEIKCCWNCAYSLFDKIEGVYCCIARRMFLARLEMPTPTECEDWKKSNTTEI